MQSLRRRLLGGLDGNAYYSIIMEPLWAVFGGMIFFYQPLYMKHLNVTEVQMGFLNSLAAALAVITSFVAGPITDRFGRKRTTLVFDLVCWSMTMFVWAISQNYWYFLLAVILNSFNKISYISWTCLSIEDTPEDKRVYFFSLIMIINLASGIFAPLAGVLVEKIGVVDAMRIIYGLGCISMTTMFLIRNKYVKETEIGKRMMKEHSEFSVKDKIRDYKEAIVYFYKSKVTLLMFFILLIGQLQMSFLYFQSVYLKDVIGIKESLTSMVPGISAVVNLIVYFVFMDKLRIIGDKKSLFYGLAFNTIGVLLLILVRPREYLLLFISIVFMAAGNLITIVFRETIWNNVIGERERAKIFSAASAFIALISIPAGYVSGYMYNLNPIFPFYASLILYIVAVLLSMRVNRIYKNNIEEAGI
ncbi:MFS transporter [Caloramator proteoclasticus]|uniref:Predicted arabinose efflux permease, MFS family n=1 Tax=Caloramator proteoclasticus DSM 10124 TaxID=1121262 RepID=A0A1M4T380_9CLOT|nr:MFS transporter [Caloramator proteoclasticus]SHE38919.1 Predicted arabinose efflux permease, MFS family [Caloramator proteoclasticus DSM 10124]